MPIHNTATTSQCHDLSRAIITILGRRIAKIDPHNPSGKNQNDVLWLTDNLMTRRPTKRAMIISPALQPNTSSPLPTKGEPFWSLTDCDMTARGPKIHYCRTGTLKEVLQSFAHDYL